MITGQFGISRDIVAYVKRTDAMAHELLKTMPSISPVSAMVMAGDLVTAEMIGESVEAGELAAEEAVNMTGSYARWNFARKYLPEAQLFERIAELWRGSDPDDTDPENLILWRKARRAAKCLITDSEAQLPAGKVLKAYRGQSALDALGISWTLNQAIAEKFARGAGVRARIKEPVLYTTWVPRGCVLAYITGRDEAEIIVDIERAKLRKEDFTA